MEDNAKKIKIIFLGNQGVGKSSIIQRYINNTFVSEYQATIGLDFLGKTIELNNKTVRLLLFDTAGQEKYKSLIPMYIRNSHVIIIVYDITNRDSFELTNNWINETSDLDKTKTFYVILGNKIDLEYKRAVTKEEAEKFANEKNFIFDEVSAKTGDNIENVFKNKIIPKIQTFILHETPENIENVEDNEINNEDTENKQEQIENNNIDNKITNIDDNNMNNNIELKNTNKTKKKGCCGGKKTK